MVRVHNEERSSMRVAPCFAVVTGLLVGCSEDLGVCEMSAAMQPVYAPDGTPYYAGQALVQYACADGVCHSATAANDARKGAPFDLNFDLRPLSAQSTAGNIVALRNGVAKVRDDSHDMYGEIVGGTMPPGAAGARTLPTWKLGNGQPAGLPGLDTDAGKATVRNWLACGAPVVSGVTPAPADAMQIASSTVLPALDTGPVAGGFSALYASVIMPCGASCHKPGGVYDGLDLSSAAVAFTNLTTKESNPGACMGKGKYVTAGDCDKSLAYLKLTMNAPCGVQMPQGGPYLAQKDVDAMCTWIKDGAKQ
jgi:hypothetical protein